MVVAAAGCGGGGGGAPVDTTVAIAWPVSPSGSVPIAFTLADPGGAPADLQVEVSLDDGATWRAARFAAGSSTSGLPTSPAGTTTTLTWNSLADLGFRSPTARLRAVPRRNGQSGAAVTATVPAIDNLRLAAAQVELPMIHYGALDAATLALAKTHDLVVVHPFTAQLQAATIRELQLGVDPLDPSDDVIVLAYISIGEDLRTVGLTDGQMLLDARFVGDATGPRIDPRGPSADGQSLLGLDPLGSPTNAPGGTQYASFYLDDNSVDRSGTSTGDGLPDRNGNFGGCFINAGDPTWFDVLDAMTFDGPDGMPGMRELLRGDVGRGYACDGLFLDTVDTCAPNSYTDGSSANQSEFEWTAPGFADFMATLRTRYPDRLVLQNRGLFLFDPRLPHYAVTTRASVDFVLVESYRLDSSSAQQFHPYFFPDNRNNFAPKLLAEAGRPDGFRVLSLGYAEGPGIAHDTLLGTSTVGLATLLEDIAEATTRVGFAHYLTDAGVALANAFVRDHLPVDASPPAWTSTYNDNANSYPTPPDEPTPRAGLQRADAGIESLTVHWDVAIDQHRVGYALYVATTPFDFTADPTLASAQRIVLTPAMGEDYELGVGPGVYPYQATLDGLPAGVTHYLCLRAFDALGNEERNESALTATPYPVPQIAIDGSFGDWGGVPVAHIDPDDASVSAGPDWREIALWEDADNLYLRFTSAHAFNLDGSPTYGYSRTLVFFDLDENAATGWPVGGVGSELLLAGNELFEQSAGTFAVRSLGNVAALPFTAVTECEIAVPWAKVDELRPGTTRLRILCVNDEVSDFAPDSGWLLHESAR
jgi:hypothetical protein